MDLEKPQTRSLLQKYEIPVEFLDFSYIKECNDAKMLERIVKILRSGEEGYFPDLTKCSEERLKQLKPNSKMFRVEEPMISKEFLDDEKRIHLDSEMKGWIDEMKKQDDILKNIQRQDNTNEPPIRRENRIEKNENEVMSNTSMRIKSTDYEKWDKFDADAAELKIDFDEERQREILESESNQKSKMIEVIESDDTQALMSEFEKNRLATNFKDQGNEAFKAKDYDEAIEKYSKSINMKKNAAAFNNRALVYLKQKLYLKVISDTNECLKMEPQNTKALLRKAQAFIGQNLLVQAHDTYEKVLQFDSANEIAQKEILNLKQKMPSKNPCRMKIEEIDEIEEKKQVTKKILKSEKLDLPDHAHVPELIKNIILEDPSPFDKFKPREAQTKEKLILPSEAPQDFKKKDVRNFLIQEIK